MRLRDAKISGRGPLDLGVHLFHYATSSCSQKTRIFLNLKGVDWQPHPVDLSKAENNEDWFLGINPRGLVPVLVIDGEVHIESNDILAELEDRFPDPPLFPAGDRNRIERILQEEDELHIDLRTLSFRFVFNRTKSTKPAEALENYRRHGEGIADPKKAKEVAFYDRIAAEGLSDALVRQAAAKFRAAFDKWDSRLAGGKYLLGDTLTVVDIAWYVYAKRLRLGGYPMQRFHPRLEDWFLALDARSDFQEGIALTPELAAIIAANRQQQEETATTMCDIAGWR